MKFLYWGAVGTSDLFGGRARFNAKDLISLLVSHFSVAALRTLIAGPLRADPG
jgi:hypothetical protein